MTLAMAIAMGGIALFLILGGITAYVAVTKGYNPVYWFFAGGPIGLIVALSLVNTTGDKLGPEEKVKAQKKGNLTALAITGIQILWTLGSLCLHPIRYSSH